MLQIFTFYLLIDNFKKGIDKLGNISTSVAGISSDELMELLRSSDYVEVQKGQDVVSDADLEKLLDRSELYNILQQQKTGMVINIKFLITRVMFIKDFIFGITYLAVFIMTCVVLFYQCHAEGTFHILQGNAPSV